MKIRGVYVVLFALVLVFLVPYILGYSSLENYRPCNIVSYFDCVGQNSAPKDVYDGNFIVEDFQIYENKGVNVGPLSLLNPLLYSIFFFLFFKFVGLNVTIIIAKIFFIIVSYFLVYKIGKFVFEKESFAILFSVAIVTQMIYKDLFLMIFYLISVISPGLGGSLLGLIGRDFSNLVVHSPLIFDRVTRPNITFVFLALSVYLLLKVLSKRSIPIKRLALYGFVWSLLFYSYFYNFVVFFFTVGILILFYLFKDKAKFRNLIRTSIFATLFSIPFWINYFVFKNTPYYADYLTRVGVETGHFIRVLGEYFLWLFFVVVFILLCKNLKREWVYFLLAFFIAGLVGLNLQLFVGFNPEPDHFARVIVFGIEFMMLSILFVILNYLGKFRFFNKKFFNKKAVTIYLIIILLLFSLVWQVKYFNTVKDNFVMDSKEIEVYDWLNENLEETSVIVSDDLIINYHVPLYTKHDIFMGGGGGFTISDNEDLLDRAFVTLIITDYSMKEAKEVFINEWHTRELPKNETTVLRARELASSGILNYIYIARMQEGEKDFIYKGYMQRNWSYNDNDVDKFLFEYQDLSKEKTRINIEKKADYVVTKKNISDGQVFANLFIRNVFDNGAYRIYEIETI